MIITSAVTANRAELLQRARDVQNQISTDKSFPWQGAVHTESESYIGMLESAQDGTFAEIRQRAETQSAENAKKANYAALGGMALMVASIIVPLPAQFSMLKMAGVLGGMFLTNFVCWKAAEEAAKQQKFVSQLNEWETALSATQSQPQQPVVSAKSVVDAPVSVSV